MIHELKLDKLYFDQVASGQKTFEIRFNDRGYSLFDILHLKEVKRKSSGQVYEYTGRELFDVRHVKRSGEVYEYTGRELKAEVTYISAYMQRPGYIVMSIKVVENSYE